MHRNRWALIVACCIACAPAYAQTKAKDAKPAAPAADKSTGAAKEAPAEKAAPATSAAADATQPATAMPTEFRLNLFIRTTLVALNQANATNNYSVLRDLAAPSFQQANSAAKLAEAFANLRARNVDISPILFFQPKLVRVPAIQPSGHLRLSGYFETKPEQVNFDMSFERVGNDWRLFGIAVELSAPKPAVSGSNGEAPAAQAPEAAEPAAKPAAAKKEDTKTKAAKSPAAEPKPAAPAATSAAGTTKSDAPAEAATASQSKTTETKPAEAAAAAAPAAATPQSSEPTSADHVNSALGAPSPKPAAETAPAADTKSEPEKKSSWGWPF